MELGEKNQGARSERRRFLDWFELGRTSCASRAEAFPGKRRWRLVCARLLRALAQSQRGAMKAETGLAPSRIFHSSRWGVLYLSCGLSQPLKIGLRFSTKALRDSMRSLFAP